MPQNLTKVSERESFVLYDKSPDVLVQLRNTFINSLPDRISKFGVHTLEMSPGSQMSPSSRVNISR